MSMFNACVPSVKKCISVVSESVPVQSFYRDLAEITEISSRLARSRRDYAEISEISPRSRQHVCEFLNLGEIAARFPTSHRD